MRPSFNRNAVAKVKCSECGSYDLKKRKNFSHGKGSSSKASYSCNGCSSTRVEKENRRFRR